MFNKKREMKLSLFIAGTGHHISSWRYPTIPSDGALNLDFIKDLTRKAEKGKFDFVFFADGLSINKESHPNILVDFEPITLLSNLSDSTTNIGLAGTMSTTYSEPYNSARQLSSLDHLSNGRAAWNIVTTADPESASNFGNAEHMKHEKRYERADEFVHIVKGLWNSWEEDALTRNVKTGEFFNDNKLHSIEHEGDFFSVKGPLSLPMSKQGHPVLIQAGSSPRGQRLAAKYAEVVFTNQVSLEDAKFFYKSIKEQAKAFGRSEDDIIVMPGITPLLGDTDEEARAKYDLLLQLIPLSTGKKTLSRYLNDFNLKNYSFEKPLPKNIDFSFNRELEIKYEYLLTISDEYNFTLGELGQYVASRNGHNYFVGTPEALADHMEVWFKEKGADAFNVMPVTLPEDLNIFVEQVIPILQRKELFRVDYQGMTLRENLGLKIPVNQVHQKT